MLTTLLTRLDNWTLARVEQANLWLEEWLSLTQRRLELLLIAVVVISGFDVLLDMVYVHPDPIKWYFAFGILGATNYQWRCHRRPSAARVALRHHPVDKGIRLFELIVFAVFALPLAFVVVVFIPPLRFLQFALLQYMLGHIWFLYTVIAQLPGEPGRRRKLALSQLRQLFPRWLPAPGTRYGEARNA